MDKVAWKPAGREPHPRPAVLNLEELEDTFSPQSTAVRCAKRKAASDNLIEESASPDLKKGRTDKKMRRTPQPTLTQSKLTGLFQKRANGDPGTEREDGGRDGSFSEGDSLTSTETVCSPKHLAMDTASPVRNLSGGATVTGTVVTTDFLLKPLKENTEHLIKTFNVSLGLVAQKVESNTKGIESNCSELEQQSRVADERWSDLQSLTARVSALERGQQAAVEPLSRAPLSDEYLKARRSIRIWPVKGVTEGDLWGEAGEFLHTQLAMSTNDVGQDDVEDVRRVVGERMVEGVHDEVVVVFKDQRKRDLAMASSVNLARFIDQAGRPTAGTRLEVPEELADTFRLLARFGTRLRARHGAGTKRHVKFDDYKGSMYINIKLPDDSTCTRISPDMAREDLEASFREEQRANGKRLASKLVPGPRERLSRPMIEIREAPVIPGERRRIGGSTTELQRLARPPA